MNLEEVKFALERTIAIGMALSSERDLEVLLEMIVTEARRLTGADGGTLFLLNAASRQLEWAIVQNETMGISFGGKSDGHIDPEKFRPIALDDAHGEPAIANVASYVVHHPGAVQIDDVYDEHDAFDFEGPIRFDEQTGYRTLSMLVVPLLHFDGGVVGVLQLINARDALGQSVPFAHHQIASTMALASQGAVAVKNAMLFKELEDQFEAFIRVIATAIDEKSPYTAGHVKRVVDVTMRIARAIDRAEQGPYADVSFDDDALKALKIAAWMHDIGKIATPEYVVDKATKLETIFDRIAIIEERFAKLRAILERDALHARLAALSRGEPIDLAQQDVTLEARCAELEEELAFMRQCNQGSEFMSDAKLARLEEIAHSPYTSPVDGETYHKLTANELENLAIRKGTLTHEEIEIIRDHARISYVMLQKLPFGRHLKDVPEIAAGHHEKLNGKGYPRGLTAEELSLPARILAVADIFEALTARDRPYKRPSPLSMVDRILGFMVKDGELDPELVEFARRSGVLDAYARDEVSAEQCDFCFVEGSAIAKN